MKLVHIGFAVLAAMALVGCSGGAEATPAPAVSESGAMTYPSEALDTSYEGALDTSSQLILGTMRLEETEHAVTPEQAATLLPLWQALQGGVTAQAEVSALMKQIQETMTAEQLDAIAAMRLTQEDMQTWMQEQGLGMGGGSGQPGGGQGQPSGGGQGLSEEERATRQAEFAAGGGGFGDGEMPPEMATRQAGFASMSEAEREAMRATMEAGGGMPGGIGGRPGDAGGGRQPMMLLNPLIELLTRRAAE